MMTRVIFKRWWLFWPGKVNGKRQYPGFPFFSFWMPHYEFVTVYWNWNTKVIEITNQFSCCNPNSLLMVGFSYKTWRGICYWSKKA